MSRRLHHWAGRARWASMLCLWVYVVSLGWVMPLCTATLATLDDDHRVQVAVGEQGTRVVLAHDLSDPAKTPWHEHCPVSATLVALAPQASGTADHVLSFPAAVKLERSCSAASAADVVVGPELVGLCWTVPGCSKQSRTVTSLREVLTPTACAVVRATVFLC